MLVTLRTSIYLKDVRERNSFAGVPGVAAYG